MIAYDEAWCGTDWWTIVKKSVKVVLTCPKKITRHTGKKSIAWFLSPWRGKPIKKLKGIVNRDLMMSKYIIDNLAFNWLQ